MHLVRPEYQPPPTEEMQDEELDSSQPHSHSLQQQQQQQRVTSARSQTAAARTHSSHAHATAVPAPSTSIPLHMQLPSTHTNGPYDDDDDDDDRQTSRHQQQLQPYYTKAAPTSSQDRATAMQRHQQIVDQFQLTRLFPVLRNSMTHRRANGTADVIPEKLPNVRIIAKKKRRTHLTRTAQTSTSPSRQPSVFSSRAQSAPLGAQRIGSFDPSSPMSNYNAMRAREANDGLMSSLSPRTHYRAVQHQSYDQSSPQMRHSSLSNTSRSGSMPLASPSHPRPFMPVNPSEARSVFASKVAGPFLASSGPFQPYSLSFRENHSPRSSSQKPFILGGSLKGASKLTAVDYYLNSPDQAVKQLELQWTREQADINRKKFLRQLRKQQEKERWEQNGGSEDTWRENSHATQAHRRNDSLPPRPLAFN